jgi:hypothetical protein
VEPSVRMLASRRNRVMTLLRWSRVGDPGYGYDQ